MPDRQGIWLSAEEGVQMFGGTQRRPADTALARPQQVLKILLYESSRLLAEALAFELRSRGHDVELARRRSDVAGLAMHQPPDIVVISDVLSRHAVRPLAAEVARGVPAPVLVLDDEAGKPPRPVPGGPALVGSGRSLRAVVDAIEDGARGKVVHAPERHADGGRTGLTPREREVVSLLAEGASTNSIASELKVSASTARTYVQHVLQKLGAHSRIEAVSMVGLDGARLLPTPVQQDRRRPPRPGFGR